MRKNQHAVLIGLLLLLPFQSLVAQQRPAATPEQTQLKRIELLERRLSAMSDLILKVDALQREVQQLRGEIEVQNHAMDALKKRQRDLYLDVDQRLNQLSHGSAPMAGSTSRPPSAPVVDGDRPAAPMADATSRPAPDQPTNPSMGAATPVEPSADQTALAAPIDPVAEEAEYKRAFGLLMQRRYGEARDAFQQFLARYAGGSYADNAQYWLAEASYVTRDFDVALVEFQRVINDYPNSSKVPDAMLKSSFIYYEKQQWDASRELLQKLVTLYPNSTASRLATQRLDRMQSEGH